MRNERRDERKISVCLLFLAGDFRLGAEAGRMSPTKGSLAKGANARSFRSARNQVRRAHEDTCNALLATRELPNMKLARKWRHFVLKPTVWGNRSRWPNCSTV